MFSNNNTAIHQGLCRHEVEVRWGQAVCHRHHSLITGICALDLLLSGIKKLVFKKEREGRKEKIDGYLLGSAYNSKVVFIPQHLYFSLRQALISI